MLRGSNEYYQLNLEEDTFQVMAGFGGGMHTEEFCGAVSGGVAVIGVLFSVKNGYDKGRVKEATKAFVETFSRELSSTNCKELKDHYREEAAKCSPVVIKGAIILAEVLEGCQKSDRTNQD